MRKREREMELICTVVDIPRGATDGRGRGVGGAFVLICNANVWK